MRTRRQLSSWSSTLKVTPLGLARMASNSASPSVGALALEAGALEARPVLQRGTAGRRPTTARPTPAPSGSVGPSVR